MEPRARIASACASSVVGGLVRRAALSASIALGMPVLTRAQHEHHAPPREPPAAEPTTDQGVHGPHAMHAMRALLGDFPAAREASGTSWVPDSSPVHGGHGRHFELGAWSCMLHGMATLVYDDQAGPRGSEDIFGTNMLMLQGSRPLGAGRLGLRGMLSLEAATVGQDGYPLLFQTGETSDGRTPLVDAQHPHDLFMELAGTYSLPVAADRSVFAYLGLPGEPALGPPTFMHRFSGMENPEAPLGHHWLDSTHVSFGVATLGATWGRFKLEGSLFNGREPDEERWNVETEPLDSESVRLSFNPARDWALQISAGSLHAPEQLDPDRDVLRTTFSAIYNRAWEGNNWQTTFAAGRNDDDPGEATDALLLESAVTFGQRDTWFARLERVEESELFDAGHPLAGSTFAIDKLSLGYLREVAAIGGVQIGLGALGSVYSFDEALEPDYGEHPRSFLLFLRARL
jgi:hypothetical protein